METENKKILSIIIPTYNAAKFLDKGLSSFIIDDNSLLNMLDIIVVNDGSTDNSVEIAQKYVNKYPDVYRILNKENGGHGSAINEGVKIIKEKNNLKIENTKEYINESNVAENIMKSYVNCKKGEYYYYRGMLFLNAKNNILEGEECLEKADKYYELSIFEKNENSEIVNQYIYNVRAYINQILYKYNKNEDKQKAKENVKRAVRFSQKACENYGNTRYSKDYRNYGANIELELAFENNDEGKNIQTSDWIKRMKEAYHQYELAKNIDNNDVKILTCLASNILKQFDKAVDLDGHLDNLKYTCDLDKKELLKALKKYNIDVNDINKAYNYLVRAQVNDVNNDAAHYHMIHVYMYKIILSDTPKEKERLIYKAKNEIAYCEAYYFENNPSIAFLYKAYKFYCANNYKNRAKLYWEEIHKNGS